MICPDCKSKKIIKRGKRKTRFDNTQIYYCKKCGKRFADKILKHKMYSPQIIYNALNYYNLGNTLDKSSRLINKKYKVKTHRSTIFYWIKKYRDFCPILTIRDNFSDKKGKKNVLFTKRFEHENLDYEFMYHTYKLDTQVKEQFRGLFRYITNFESGCPDTFFEVGKRCSKPSFQIKVKVRKTNNLACKIAGFAVKAACNNRDRHKIVEKFMLINDKATIACEIPVWYWDKKIDNGVTGHIDLIQVRNSIVYILDYKPDASKDKKATDQLYHYALGLSFRTKTSLEKIRCAWFDKDGYYEYNPSEAKCVIPRLLSSRK